MKGFEELTLELTDWCPSKCLHCSSESSPSCTNGLPYELTVCLIKEAGKLGAAKVSLGGGEPTADENFLPVVHQVLETGMLVEVFTCGLFSTTQGTTSLPPTIIESCAGIKGIKFIFSFHGASAETHDHITQTLGSYDNLINSLQNCLQANIECEMNFVPLKININDFGQLINLATDFQIPRISILRFVPQGRGALNQSELELNPDEEDLFISEVIRMRENTSIEIRTGSPFNGIVPGNQVPCRAGFGKLVVQADGNVLPCEVFKHHKRRQWDLSVHNMTLSQILASPQISNLYKRLQHTNCLECPVHQGLRKSLQVENCHAISKTPVHAK
ncbi:MAG: radical SAM protein [Sedimentisphaerales bacterium]|nr:radical SAM protein [Sedimentisphaerales bacterium]